MVLPVGFTAGRVLSGEVFGWNLSTASLVNTGSVSGGGILQGIFIHPDGTSIYTCDSGQDRIEQYGLSTAFDITTISGSEDAFIYIGGVDNNPQDLFFKPDGLECYFSSQNKTLKKLTLTTAWDISTASISSDNFSIADDNLPTGLYFKNDGTKFWITGRSADAVFAYSMSTAWDITTASYDGDSFSVSSQGTNPTQLWFQESGANAGLKMFVSDTQTNTVKQYSLTTAYDITTASYDSVSLGGAQGFGMCFDLSGTRLYTSQYPADTIRQYSVTE